MIKAYIINLDRNPERMNLMKDRLDTLEIPHERFQAIDGQTISDEAFQTFSTMRPKVGALGKWTKAKMGCNMSHSALWEKIAHAPDPYGAIFEDDLHISDDLKTLMESSDWIPQDCDIIRLEPPAIRILLSKKVPCSVAGRTVQEILPNRFSSGSAVGAGAYIIKREAAQKILHFPDHEHVYVDHTLFNCAISAIARETRVFQLSPACCIQDVCYHKNKEDVVLKSNIALPEDTDIYVKKNICLRHLIRWGRKIGLLQAYKALRALLYILRGYRKVPYIDEMT